MSSKLAPLNHDHIHTNRWHNCLRSNTDTEPAAASWSQLWLGQPQRRHVILALHYAWAMYILLFNSMVLNIAAYGQRHIHMNTVVIGGLIMLVN